MALGIKEKIIRYIDAEQIYKQFHDNFSNENKTTTWQLYSPFIFMHLGCLGVFFVGASAFAVGAAIFLYFFRMFAITGFYHRYFSHRTFKTSRFMQFIFAVWGMLAVQKGPLWWAAHHRVHHKYSDSKEDVHSPTQKGFWWSHIAWIACPENMKTDYTLLKDFEKFPELRFLNRFDWLVPTLYGVSLTGIGYLLEKYAPGLHTNAAQLFVWGFFVSTMVLYHGTFSINSLSHVWGNQRFKTGDTSRNNPILAIVTLGEGWHNNHHFYSSSVRQGFYWWEYDITYYIIKLMSFFGLVWDLKPVPKRIYDLAERQEELSTR